MKRRKIEESTPGAPLWMNTFADMFCLLLTFFVMLYSFSTIDSDKWDRIASAISGGTGVLLHNDPVQNPVDKNNRAQNQVNIEASLIEELKKFEGLYDNIKEYINKYELQEYVFMTKTDNEIRIRFTNSILFDSGQAILKSEAYPILNEFSDIIMEFSDSIQMIRVEGHTDNLPISTREFPSNWELSTARAVGVLRYLVEEKNIPPTIISAAGYGEYHPFADNNLEEGRIKNRRVDFVIARSKR